jgi:hypothetical protein
MCVSVERLLSTRPRSSDDLASWSSAKHFTSWLGPGAEQQDLRGQNAVGANAPLRRARCGTIAACCRNPHSASGDSRRASARPRRSPPRRARSQSCSTMPCGTEWSTSAPVRRLYAETGRLVTYDDAIKIKNGVHWEDSANWTLDEDLPIERDLFGLVCAIINLKNRSQGSSWHHEY